MDPFARLRDLTADQMRRLFAYGGDPRNRRVVTEAPLNEWCSEEWSLKDFVKLINKIAASIPEAQQASARVAFRSGGDDESGFLKIAYERPETDEEVTNRIDRGLAYVDEQERRDLATYEALKKKYG